MHPAINRLVTLGVLFLFAASSLTALADAGSANTANDRPDITGQVTFFYYKDLSAAAAFYENILGLKATLDDDWVKIFAITANSSVGLVDETKGLHKVSADKPAMLSIVTTDIDAWYGVLKDKNIKFVLRLDKEKNNGFVYNFIMEDPGGYTVEIFQWI